jgi:uncharacterized metal-binding protein
MEKTKMVDLPKKKVGIVACSGEELPEGTITRLAALRVLEQLRPDDTVTICLPLFLAGGEGDRAFAKFYPTIAVDGCELRCAARATEMYSSKPAATVIVSRVVAENSLERPEGKRRPNSAGFQAVEAVAERMASLVDLLLRRHWNRKTGSVVGPEPTEAAQKAKTAEEKPATCSCMSSIPTQKIIVDGREVTLVALPIIFEQFQQSGKKPSTATAGELLDTVKVYNPLPAEADKKYREALDREYSAFCAKRETTQ